MGYKHPSSGLPFKEMGSSPAKDVRTKIINDPNTGTSRETLVEHTHESPAKGKGDNLHRISQENKALRKARGTFYAPGAAPQPKTPNVPGFNIEGSKFSKANTPGFETTKIGKEQAARKKFNLRQASKQKGTEFVEDLKKKGDIRTSTKKGFDFNKRTEKIDFLKRNVIKSTPPQKLSRPFGPGTRPIDPNVTENISKIKKGVKNIIKTGIKRFPLVDMLIPTKTATADQPTFPKGDIHYRDPEKSIFKTEKKSESRKGFDFNKRTK